jgi:hypothetical protein
LLEGLKPGGRVRLPVHPIPPVDKKKMKGFTQEGKILAMIKRPGGAYNFVPASEEGSLWTLLNVVYYLITYFAPKNKAGDPAPTTYLVDPVDVLAGCFTQAPVFSSNQ